MRRTAVLVLLAALAGPALADDQNDSDRAALDALSGRLMREPKFLEKLDAKLVLESAALSGATPLQTDFKVPIFKKTADRLYEGCGGERIGEPEDEFELKFQARVPVLLTRLESCKNDKDHAQKCRGCYKRHTQKESLAMIRDALAEDAAKSLQLPEKISMGPGGGEVFLYTNGKLSPIAIDVLLAVIERTGLETANGLSPLDLLRAAESLAEGAGSLRPGGPSPLRRRELAEAAGVALSLYDRAKDNANEPPKAAALEEELRQTLASLRQKEDPNPARAERRPPRLAAVPEDAQAKISDALKALSLTATGARALKFYDSLSAKSPSVRPASRSESNSYPWIEPVMFLEDSSTILIDRVAFATATPKALGALILSGIVRLHQGEHRVPLDSRCVMEAQELMAVYLAESSFDPKEDFAWGPESKPYLTPVQEAFSDRRLGLEKLEELLRARYAGTGAFTLGIEEDNKTPEAKAKAEGKLQKDVAALNNLYRDPKVPRLREEYEAKRREYLEALFGRFEGDDFSARDWSHTLETRSLERAQAGLFADILSQEIETPPHSEANFADKYHSKWEGMIKEWREASFGQKAADREERGPRFIWK